MADGQVSSQALSVLSYVSFSLSALGSDTTPLPSWATLHSSTWGSLKQALKGLSVEFALLADKAAQQVSEFVLHGVRSEEHSVPGEHTQDIFSRALQRSESAASGLPGPAGTAHPRQFRAASREPLTLKRVADDEDRWGLIFGGLTLLKSDAVTALANVISDFLRYLWVDQIVSAVLSQPASIWPLGHPREQRVSCSTPREPPRTPQIPS